MYSNCKVGIESDLRVRIKIRRGVPRLVDQSLLAQESVDHGIVYQWRSPYIRNGWTTLPHIERRYRQIFDRLLLEGVVIVQLDPDGVFVDFASKDARDAYMNHFAQIINEVVDTHIRMADPSYSVLTRRKMAGVVR